MGTGTRGIGEDIADTQTTVMCLGMIPATKENTEELGKSPHAPYSTSPNHIVCLSSAQPNSSSACPRCSL